jgi:2-polyprenyl-6-methoxyphenol hydroxylase-like FAD-dependent oxidoreductase
MKILIAGGGIGGLTTALCLAGAGMEVQVFESVGELKPLGVGINLLPHSVRVLTQLGLQDTLAEAAVETSDLAYYNRFGQCYWTEPRGLYAGYKWPQFSIHRGNLQMLLFDAVRKRLGDGAIQLNRHLRNFKQDKEGVTAYFVEKDTGTMVKGVKADILIAVDGINSAARGQLYPKEGPPLYSENVLYRGTTLMEAFGNGKTMAMIGSMRQKMVVYPISSQPDEKGRVLLNWVANLNEGKSALKERDWNREADKEHLVRLYKDWNFDWLDVPEMISGADAVYEFPMSDRDPLPQWSFGRVTLLGDAAHPMYPIGSNGASQAILDGECLVRCLNLIPHPEEALIAYEKERLPATTKVVLQNRAKGPDEIMDMMEERFPKGFKKHEIPHDELKLIMDHYKKIAGFDVKTLNALGT